MTPTEQDKELRELYKQIRNNSRVILYSDVMGRPDEDGKREQTLRDDLWAISTAELDKFMQLITADRKRVAIEARIDEVNQLYNEHLRRWDDDECDIYKNRIAELKRELDK